MSERAVASSRDAGTARTLCMLRPGTRAWPALFCGAKGGAKGLHGRTPGRKATEPGQGLGFLWWKGSCSSVDPKGLLMHELQSLATKHACFSHQKGISAFLNPFNESPPLGWCLKPNANQPFRGIWRKISRILALCLAFRFCFCCCASVFCSLKSLFLLLLRRKCPPPSIAAKKESRKKF